MATIRTNPDQGTKQKVGIISGFINMSERVNWKIFSIQRDSNDALAVLNSDNFENDEPVRRFCFKIIYNYHREGIVIDDEFIANMQLFVGTFPEVRQALRDNPTTDFGIEVIHDFETRTSTVEVISFEDWVNKAAIIKAECETINTNIDISNN